MQRQRIELVLFGLLQTSIQRSKNGDATLQISVFGAAGEVAGSCYLVKVNGYHILLECGLLQGNEEREERNADPFPFDPKRIDAVILSHAHIDHAGRLPLLVKRG